MRKQIYCPSSHEIHNFTFLSIFDQKKHHSYFSGMEHAKKPGDRLRFTTILK